MKLFKIEKFEKIERSSKGSFDSILSEPNDRYSISSNGMILSHSKILDWVEDLNKLAIEKTANANFNLSNYKVDSFFNIYTKSGVISLELYKLDEHWAHVKFRNGKMMKGGYVAAAKLNPFFIDFKELKKE